MASAMQSQKRGKSERFIKGDELNRKKLCAETFRVVIQQCSEGEKGQKKAAKVHMADPR